MALPSAPVQGTGESHLWHARQEALAQQENAGKSADRQKGMAIRGLGRRTENLLWNRIAAYGLALLPRAGR
jgi:hypothetical protein